MYTYTPKNYPSELKSTQNSITAYRNLVDCSDKTPTQMENESFHALDSCFEDIFFVELEGTKSFLRNTSRALGAITSLGGAYVFALQKKHYSDIYDALYQPGLNELEDLQKQTNYILDEIGSLLAHYSYTMKKAEKVLKTNSSYQFKNSSKQATPHSQVRKFNTKYNSILTNGFGGLVGGSTAIGAWSIVSIIGSASTGTAISSLSGIAATNATLAWFGGGSLAAGGAGMSGGFWVLGGIVAAPLVYFSTKSSYKKAKQIKAEKHKLVTELEKFRKLKVEASHHLKEVRAQLIKVKSVVSTTVPEIEKELSSFKSASSFTYRVFGGQMNPAQLSSIKSIETLCVESMTELGFA
ncbi:hypothetical protein HOP38_05490 [Vibrio mediterranei]|uniref:hypothetical protein n=1 Tax=Vibrio mediterranei TaxID=689 RepID=UPI0017AA6E3B|nr:hypothetical protein [Vibrio mediterranei]NUW71957.1 hypothetical protein [Vibrio mediterranei]